MILHKKCWPLTCSGKIWNCFISVCLVIAEESEFLFPASEAWWSWRQAGKQLSQCICQQYSKNHKQRHKAFIMNNEWLFMLYGVKFFPLLIGRLFCKTLCLMSVRNSGGVQLCSPIIVIRVYLNISVFKFAALMLHSCCISLWMQQWLRKQEGNCEGALLLGSSLGIKMTALIIYAVKHLHWQVVWGKGGGQKTHLLIFL